MKNAILFIGLFFCVNLLNAQDIIRTDKIPELVIEGTGNETLLLIPCMSCRWNEWEEFIERNRDRYTMYAITPPGFGGSPPPQFSGYTSNTPYRDYFLSGLSELIDNYKLNSISVIGHSWGVMVGTQLALKRKDVITRLIAVDGKIKEASTISDEEERLRQANNNIRDWENKLQSPEEWFTFNSGSIRALATKDSVDSETMMTQAKLFGSFMATDKDVMLQSWRENFLIDLSSELKKLTIPILDIQSLMGKNQNVQKKRHLTLLKEIGVGQNIQSVFMYDTKHFIMFHRPLQLDDLINDFIEGKSLKDFAPKESAYFKSTLSIKQKEILAAINGLSGTTSTNGKGADAYGDFLSEDFSRWTIGSSITNDKHHWVEGIREWFDDGWRVSDRKQEIMEIVISNEYAHVRRNVTETYIDPNGDTSTSKAALAEIWNYENNRWILFRVNVYPILDD